MSDPVIELDVGKIRGKSQVVDGVGIESYLKVPFAEPPVGGLRLEKPVPKSPWSETLDCLEFPKSAIPLVAPILFPFSEDCLYLNIFRPAEASAEPCPILFMVHGGGFEFGTGMRYGNLEENAKKFISTGIIMVAIQYRLAVLGFASDASDPSLNGNLGLFDQAEALNFVHRNANALNGDPNKITVYGCSAGGVSTSYLMLSPLTCDKIFAGISLSGSGLTAWANCELVKEKTAELAKELGMKEGETAKSVLKRAKVEDIIKATRRIGETYDNQNFTIFGPHLDGEFFPKDLPELIAEAPKKPYIMGCTHLESLLWTLLSISDISNTMAIPPQKQPNFGRSDLVALVDKLVKPDMVKQTSEAREEFVNFYDNQSDKKDNIYYMYQYTQLYADLQFNIPILLEIWLKNLAGWDVFAYQNDYINEKVFPDKCPIKVSYHGLDQRYLIQGHGFSQPEFFDDNDRKVEKFLVDSVVNFIKTGNPSTPTFDWPKTTVESPFQHIRITENPTLQHDFFANNLKFYGDLMTKYEYDFPRMIRMSTEEMEKQYHVKKLIQALKSVKKGKL